MLQSGRNQDNRMRTEQTPADLERISQDLAEVQEVLHGIVTRMKTEGVPALLLHANTANNKHLRALWEWSKKIETDAELQFRAFAQGKADRARFDQQQAKKRSRRPPR
jgi:hypothetical protein